MALVVIYNTVDGQVLQIIPSANTPEYEGRGDVLINPIIPGGVPQKYLKVVAGALTEQTAAEKSATDASIANDNLNLQRLAATKLQFPIEDIIVALVKRINVRIPANPITKQEIIDQLKADKGL